MAKDAQQPKLLKNLSVDDVRRIVLEDSVEAQKAFLADWSEAFDEAVVAIAQAHSGLEQFREELTGDLRVATVEMFLHSAVYSLVAALHHLVTGYPIAAGHMMRHFYESFAMAALCTDPDAQVLEAFTANRRGYPVDAAPDKLRRKKSATRLAALLGLDPEAWVGHLDKNVDFGGRSHASGLTLAFQMMLETDNALVLGGQYDPAKAHAYDADLRRIRACATDLATLCRACIDPLKKG